MMLAACAVALGACSAQKTKPPPDFGIPDSRKLVDDANALAQQAAKAAEEGDVDRAIELYRQAVSTSRDLAGAWNNLGTLLMEQERYFDATEAFAVASELRPTDPRPLYNIGLAWLTIDYPEKAAPYFEQALDRSPTYQPALRSAIRAAQQLDRADQKLADRIQQALIRESDPDWRKYLQDQRSRVEGRLAEYDAM